MKNYIFCLSSNYMGSAHSSSFADWTVETAGAADFHTYTNICSLYFGALAIYSNRGTHTHDLTKQIFKKRGVTQKATPQRSLL